MSKVYAGAMMTIMALCVFMAVIPLGAVAPDVAFPAYGLIGLLAFLWAGRMLSSSPATWVSSPLHLPVACFTIYAFARYFLAPYEYDARLELFQIGASAVVYVCCALYFNKPGHRRLFVVVLLLLALVQAGFGVWQVATKAETVLLWDRPSLYQARAGGTFIYPNHMAAFLEMVLGWAMAYAVAGRRPNLTTERWVLLRIATIYALLMTIVGILLSWSRGGWVAALIGGVAFVAFSHLRKPWRWGTVGLVLLVLVAVGGIAVSSNVISNRLLNTFESTPEKGSLAVGDKSLGGRTIMWEGSLRILRDYPLLGTGPGSWQWVFQRYKKADYALLTRPDYAHNEYLNLAADYGLVGVGLMLWVMVAFFRHAWVLRGSPDPEKYTFALGALVGVIALLVHCAFDFVLHIPANSIVLAAMLGLTAGAEVSPQRFASRRLGWARRPLAFAVGVLCAGGLWFFIPTAVAYRQNDLGGAYRQDLEYDTALGYFMDAEASDPRFHEPPAGIGDVYRTMANWRLGPEKLPERLRYATNAIAAYDRSLRLNPDQSLVWVERAKMAAITGDGPEAERSFRRAIEVYPSNSFAYFAYGCFLRDRGELTRAREMFEKSNQYNSTPSAALNTWDIDTRPKPDPAVPSTNSPPSPVQEKP